MIPLKAYNEEFSLAREKRKVKLFQSRTKEMQERALVTPRE